MVNGSASFVSVRQGAGTDSSPDARCDFVAAGLAKAFRKRSERRKIRGLRKCKIEWPIEWPVGDDDGTLVKNVDLAIVIGAYSNSRGRVRHCFSSKCGQTTQNA